MAILDPTSLAATVDAVNDAFFLKQAIPQDDRRLTAAWIAGRQGLAGCYAEMFAPTKKDMSRSLSLFTGETINTGAGRAHILGEEAARALLLLGARGRDRAALDRAVESIFERMSSSSPDAGWYCCAKCSAALWRHMSVSDAPRAERILASGLRQLKRRRDGEGRWNGMPFHYTLSALVEMPLPAARAELRYAAPAVERALLRPRGDDIFSSRRRKLAETALSVL